MDDMKLPAGKTCADCRNWARCKKFIGSLTGKETTCDWAPSRFEESNESLMRQIEAQNKFITDVQDQRDKAYDLIDVKDALIESQKEEIEALHDAFEMLPPKDVEIHERTQHEIDKTVSRVLIESLQTENKRLMAVNQHLEIDLSEAKAITELAVKALKWYANKENYKLQNSDVYDAGGFAEYNVLGDNGSKAKATLSEIERLSNETNLP